jgi:ADP-heptose:LPS heptosyltransferase
MAAMDELKTPTRILLIKLRKLGDVINTTPAVRAIRAQYPKAEITYLTEPLGAKVFEFSDDVDQVWLIKRKISNWEYMKLCIRIYRYDFDLVVDFYQHNKTRLITLFSQAPLRLGFSNKPDAGKSLVYNKTVHLTEDNYTNLYGPIHNLKLINLLGLGAQDYQISLSVNQETIDFGKAFAQEYGINKKTIAFCAQSERAEAQVPAELLAQIGNSLISKGYNLYFVYGPGERSLAEPVYAEIEDKSSCIIDYEVPTIAQVRAIFEHCAMYIGNDGGNKHLAVTAGIPTIGIFWGDAPNVWTPPEKANHRFLQTKNNTRAFEEFLEIFESWSSHTTQFEVEKSDNK